MIGEELADQVYESVPDVRIGRAVVLRPGSDVAILACGSTVRPALDAAAALASSGIDAGVVDVHTLKPLDVEAVTAIAASTGAVLTVEEHNVTGALGTAVAEALLEGGLGGRVRFRRHGVPDEHVPIGPPAALYAHYRLNADGIAAVTQELLA